MFQQQARSIVRDITLDTIKDLESWGIMADFRHSYTTMQSDYEANVMERFADLQDKDLINMN